MGEKARAVHEGLFSYEVYDRGEAALKKISVPMSKEDLAIIDSIPITWQIVSEKTFKQLPQERPEYSSPLLVGGTVLLAADASAGATSTSSTTTSSAGGAPEPPPAGTPVLLAGKGRQQKAQQEPPAPEAHRQLVAGVAAPGGTGATSATTSTSSADGSELDEDEVEEFFLDHEHVAKAQAISRQNASKAARRLSTESGWKNRKPTAAPTRRRQKKFKQSTLPLSMSKLPLKRVGPF
jgi:hypothetical protein